MFETGFFIAGFIVGASAFYYLSSHPLNLRLNNIEKEFINLYELVDNLRKKL